MSHRSFSPQDQESGRAGRSALEDKEKVQCKLEFKDDRRRKKTQTNGYERGASKNTENRPLFPEYD